MRKASLAAGMSVEQVAHYFSYCSGLSLVAGVYSGLRSLDSGMPFYTSVVPPRGREGPVDPLWL